MQTPALTGFVRRNRTTFAIALACVLASSGTAAAASYLVLSTTNTASTTTTLKSAVNGTVLSIQNTNSTGGTSARGLSISVPAGRAPISVSSTAGKATNLNADKLDGHDSTYFGQVRAFAQSVAGSGVGDTIDLASLDGFTLTRHSWYDGTNVECDLLLKASVPSGHLDFSDSAHAGASWFETGGLDYLATVQLESRSIVGHLVYLNYSTNAVVTVEYAVYDLPNHGGCRWSGTMVAGA